ncbi:echinoderm microtubule-associated protein-like 1 [Branchiostoma floridae x Branchiostoma japonicum]
MPAFKLDEVIAEASDEQLQQQHRQPVAKSSTEDSKATNSPQLKRTSKPKPLLRVESSPNFKLSGEKTEEKSKQMQKPKPLLRVESVPIFNLTGEKTEEKSKKMPPKPKPLLRGQSLPIFNLTGDRTAEMAKQRRFVSESTSTLRMSGSSVEFKKQEITDKPIGQNGVFRQYLRGRPITMFAPSDSADQGAKKEPTLPTEMLRAEWVYGYRGRDCADNLHELASGEIIYNIASVAVLYDPRAGTQRHYLGHNSSIQCLAVHPAGVLVTSGQVMGVNRREQISVYEKFDGFYGTPDPNWYKPHVRVWDSKTLQTLAVIGGGKLQFGVCAVSFSVSDGGDRVLAVDDSPGKIMTVWDWKNGNLLCEAVATRDLLETAAFHPMDSDMMVTAGKNHLGFWTIKKITAGSSSKAFLTMKKGLFAEHQAKFVHCLDFGDNGDVITGDSKGSILVWKKGCNRISHANPVAHKGGIMALRVTSEGTLVTGGGKDRRVVLWDRSYTRPLRECKLEAVVSR